MNTAGLQRKRAGTKCQNYFPGWSAFPAREIEGRDGLLAVRVEKSDNNIILTYKPMSYKLGLAISVITTVVFFTIIICEFRRRELEVPVLPNAAGVLVAVCLLLYRLRPDEFPDGLYDACDLPVWCLLPIRPRDRK